MGKIEWKVFWGFKCCVYDWEDLIVSEDILCIFEFDYYIWIGNLFVVLCCCYESDIFDEDFVIFYFVKDCFVYWWCIGNIGGVGIEVDFDFMVFWKYFDCGFEC